MSFLRTSLGTEHRKPPGLWQRLFAIDTANPSYCNKHHLVRSWLIEFDESGGPWREIALDEHDGVVFAGPSTTDYGFWHDTGMLYENFVGMPVTREFFESKWKQSGVVAP